MQVWVREGKRELARIKEGWRMESARVRAPDSYPNYARRLQNSPRIHMQR